MTLRILYFWGFILSINLVSAQITITSSDFPEAGFTYIVVADTTTQVSIGSPAATAQSWNFTNLLNHYQKVPTYDSTQKTPYAGLFPTSDLYTYGPAILYSGFYGSAPVGTQGINNGYVFWRRDNTGFWVEGFRADGGPYAGRNVYYTPHELLIGTPSTYNSNYQNFSRWQLFLNDVPTNMDTLYVCSTTKTLTTDAFGSLTTPVGSYSDVVRVHEHVIKVDSIYAYQNGNLLYGVEAIRDTLNNYLFLTNSISYPACIVHADKNNHIKFTEYVRSKILTSNETLLESNTYTAQVFPNPAQNKVSIVMPAGFLSDQSCQLSVYDITGKCVRDVIQAESLFYVNDLPDGLYSFKAVNSKNQQLIGKFIISN